MIKQRIFFFFFGIIESENTKYDEDLNFHDIRLDIFHILKHTLNFPTNFRLDILLPFCSVNSFIEF